MTINIRTRRKARRLALQAFYQWLLTHDEMTAIEKQFLDDQDLNTVDVLYFQRLLQAVPVQVEKLDALMQPYLDRPLAEVNPIEKSILRMAILELVEHLDIPYKVVINEALELAKTFGGTDSHKYINGILDPIARVIRAQEQ
jgi:transcription antitermination protein NusB